MSDVKNWAKSEDVFARVRKAFPGGKRVLGYAERSFFEKLCDDIPGNHPTDAERKRFENEFGRPDYDDD